MTAQRAAGSSRSAAGVVYCQLLPSVTGHGRRRQQHLVPSIRSAWAVCTLLLHSLSRGVYYTLLRHSISRVPSLPRTAAGVRRYWYNCAYAHCVSPALSMLELRRPGALARHAALRCWAPRPRGACGVGRCSPPLPLPTLTLLMQPVSAPKAISSRTTASLPFADASSRAVCPESVCASISAPEASRVRRH